MALGKNVIEKWENVYDVDNKPMLIELLRFYRNNVQNVTWTYYFSVYNFFTFFMISSWRVFRPRNVWNWHELILYSEGVVFDGSRTLSLLCLSKNQVICFCWHYLKLWWILLWTNDMMFCCTKSSKTNHVAGLFTTPKCLL